MGAESSIADNREAAFSVITISKDDAAGLARTLASVAAQSLRPREVLLVRAGRSRELAVDPACVDIADPGRGISAAFNAAIAAARGRWLVFLNGGDAFCAPSSLQSLDDACRAAPSADIVACRARTENGDGVPWRAPRSFCDFLFLSHQASAFSRDLFNEAGGVGTYSPDFRVRMDLDWMARYLARRGHRDIAFFDRYIVDYRMDGLSSTSLAGFYGEEFAVLARSPRFLPALLGLALRRLPERALRETWRRLAAPR